MNKIYIGNSKIPKAGRGVFAGNDIKKDDIIESCPMIEISEDDTANLGDSILVTYFFYYGKKKEKSGVALGFGSIYNHSYTPNAMFKINEKENIINFIALSNIKKDCEITFNYRNSTDTKTPLWFEV